MSFPLLCFVNSRSCRTPAGSRNVGFTIGSVGSKLLLAAVAISCVTSTAMGADEPAKAKATETTDGEEETELPKRHAYKLGDFRIKDYRPVEREKIKIEFTIYIEVPDGKEQRFERLWKNHEHRVRNQIITAARLVQSVEYDDPKLHHLRRRIYLRLRRALPELPVGEVFVSDFSYLVD